MKPSLLPLATALLVLTSGSAAAGEDTVLSIGNDFTIPVRNQAGERVKVRLACIDAPEASQRPAGPAARQALQQLLQVGSTLKMKVHATGRYGRTVAEVLKPGEAASMNLQIVSADMAFVYRQYLKGCDQYSYGEAETGASVNKRETWGLQLGYHLMMPWDYRACKRSKLCR
jgi:endonuclease YncB( thermonuclease family)